ncbi:MULTISPECIES: hypothetical protein [unclassified Acinetobacter]|uniref:hypothetical protein n=1 Tax=unclassified Acinetobacter TaxID=196816 RepID=UPI0035B8F260
MINQIYELDNLKQLDDYLTTFDNQIALRTELFQQFLQYADYKSASDWNKVVRLCESLAIVGWGEHEPLEAMKGTYFNGNPETYLIDKNGQRHFVDAIWSKRKFGITMEAGRTSYFQSSNQLKNQQTILWDYPTIEHIQDIKLSKQQNWIAKAPIHIKQGVINCYPNSDFLADELVKLQQLINQQMQPNKYGNMINFIDFILHLSYPSREINSIFSFCQCNYIINDNLKNKDEAHEFLKSLYNDDEIRENSYYAFNRFEYGKFMKKTGRMRIDIYFEKEFSELHHQAQKETLTKYFLLGIRYVAEKYQKLAYDFKFMIDDFEDVLKIWLK